MVEASDLLDKLTTKFVVTDNGCWEWTAYRTSRGYGRFVGRSAHRVVYETVVGHDADGLDLDHLCRNPSCVNPDHLEAVTHRENVLRGDGVAARHARANHCPQGHPYSGENLFIRSTDGARMCRACSREQSKKTYQNRKEKASSVFP